MSEYSSANIVRRPPDAGGDGTIRSELARIARIGAEAGSADACLITWHIHTSEGAVCFPPDSRRNTALAAILAALREHSSCFAESGAERHKPNPVKLKALLQNLAGTAVESVVAVKSAGDVETCAILLVPRSHKSPESERTAELVAYAAYAVAKKRAENDSREFWRKQALDAGERAARAESEKTITTAENRRLDAAFKTAIGLRSRNRFARLGALFASSGPFEAWLVAVANDGKLAIAAVSAQFASIPPLDNASAIAETFARKTTVVRTIPASQTFTFHEDRLFSRFTSYICVPFHDGVAAMAARSPIDDEIVAKVEALVARIDPIVRLWNAEAEVERLKRLVRDLGLRLFGAIDSERARIARDLHDHQAQLLAAARIALEAGPDEARGIFKQLEDAMRLRLRELKPATLGRSTTLDDALRYEMKRLADAQIKGRLVRADEMRKLTRPAQELCYQVAREALSNVIRHAAATRVEIKVEKRGRHVTLSVADNGKGIAARKDGGGLGLNGLGERLELMGGKLRIESDGSGTKLIAEIPELI